MGEGVSPDTVQLSDLIGLLRDFNSAVTATASSRGVRKEEIRISLTSIKNGSELLGFAANAPTQRQARHLLSAIAADDPGDLAPTARSAVQSMWRRTSPKGWELGLYTGENGFTRSARIVPAIEPFSSTVMLGATSLLVHVLKAGGERPTATVRLPNKSRLTARVASKEVAAELGHCLYQWIEVFGEARWNTRTLKIDDFSIKGLGPYRENAADPTAALGKISLQFGDVWSSIDPQAYVRDLRSDD